MVRTIFYGTPAFATPTLQALLVSEHKVVAVVTQPDRPRGRGRQLTYSPVKQCALEAGVPVLQPERAELRSSAFTTLLRSLNAELSVVAAYGRILPDSLLEAPRLGTINVHASLLPKYRGAAPIHRAIIAGEQETGITIIRLVSEMDAGPMLAMTRCEISRDQTSSDVQAILAKLGAKLLLETVNSLAGGVAKETDQQHSEATFAPPLTREDGHIDWNASAIDIHNLIRGLHPWPHAATMHHDTRYLLHLTNVVTHRDSSNVPGTIIEAHADQLIVSTGSEQALALLKIQQEGRKALETRAFLSGQQRWQVGTQLTNLGL
jgi:methionyl-tRNA formyltransferase|tara:strand:+ start:3303 stop:4262 length:960 start_codon:yes stop_codon:yes gene_type:complete